MQVDRTQERYAKIGLRWANEDTGTKQTKTPVKETLAPLFMVSDDQLAESDIKLITKMSEGVKEAALIIGGGTTALRIFSAVQEGSGLKEATFIDKHLPQIIYMSELIISYNEDPDSNTYKAKTDADWLTRRLVKGASVREYGISEVSVEKFEAVELEKNLTIPKAEFELDMEKPMFKEGTTVVMSNDDILDYVSKAAAEQPKKRFIHLSNALGTFELQASKVYLGYALSSELLKSVAKGNGFADGSTVLFYYWKDSPTLLVKRDNRLEVVEESIRGRHLVPREYAKNLVMALDGNVPLFTLHFKEREFGQFQKLKGMLRKKLEGLGVRF